MTESPQPPQGGQLNPGGHPVKTHVDLTAHPHDEEPKAVNTPPEQPVATTDLLFKMMQSHLPVSLMLDLKALAGPDSAELYEAELHS